MWFYVILLRLSLTDIRLYFQAGQPCFAFVLEFIDGVGIFFCFSRRQSLQKLILIPLVSIAQGSCRRQVQQQMPCRTEEQKDDFSF